MTTLCCVNQDNPRFSAFEHHTALSELSRVHWEKWVAPKLSRFESAGLSRLGHYARKVP